MKPGHAAALALVGWYLMMPPMDENHKIYMDLPIGQWQVLDSFDSAQECRQVLVQMWTAARDQGGWYKERLQSSHCFSTDDSRLKGK